ncbi:MAG: SpoIIE family protein phosphatase [Leptonema sp. (in: bacteria)]
MILENTKNEIARLQSELESLKNANEIRENQIIEQYKKIDEMLLELENKKNELKEKNDYLESINLFISKVIDSLDEILIVIDKSGFIKQVNEKFSRLLGYTKEEIMGRNPDFLFSNLELLIKKYNTYIYDDKKSKLYQILSLKHNFRIEISLISKSKKKYPHLIKSTILYDIYGKKEGIVIIGTDIGYIKKIQKNLKKSLEQTKFLKQKQDADYFLIHLLLKPFEKDNNKSKKYKTDSIIEQRTKFPYKGNIYNIGGDICYIENFRLQNKNYIFFVNADAMGKSIQGAGGSLIFSSLITSHIQFTNISEVRKNKTPEKWLTDCILEIQNTFLSFEGGMLISAVFGIIDEEEDKLYFVNCGHTKTILYRNKKASFINENIDQNKIGIPYGFNLEIQKFYFKKDDILFIGSDGKDEFRLPDGSINEDETLILKIIEETEGNLFKVLKSIKSYGTLVDDLSIIKIQRMF